MSKQADLAAVLLLSEQTIEKTEGFNGQDEPLDLDGSGKSQRDAIFDCELRIDRRTPTSFQRERSWSFCPA